MLTFLLISPGITLLIGLLSIIVIVWLFMPQKGGLALINRLGKNTIRVLLEDALKFIFDCEYNKVVCSANGLAGHLHISMDKASHLINRLSSMELISLKDQYVELTDAGRSYALRVIRVHRIWERYLADETSVAPADWHNEACRIEHLVTEEETERLAAQIGNPVFDPHGDPIPTIDGELPISKGVGLNTLNEGEIGRIIHLEDEPKSIFEQLMVLGLYVGMEVYVTDVTDKKITFVADGDECVLTPLFASQINVEKLNNGKDHTTKHELLSSLNIGEEATVLAISPNCRGQQRRRLMDLGIVPGSHISAVMKSASGDPMGYRVLGTTIGIRKQHADQVFVNRN